MKENVRINEYLTDEEKSKLISIMNISKEMSLFENLLRVLVEMYVQDIKSNHKIQEQVAEHNKRLDDLDKYKAPKSKKLTRKNR